MGDSEEGAVRVTPLVLHVLLSLADADAHAYGIMKQVEERTAGRVSVGPGSLHYTIAKLQDAGLIEERDERDAGGSGDARRRYFRITAAGGRALKAELSVWADVVEIARERDLIPGRGGS